ncbi:MAG: cyclic nucleotide-binding domain-containing protein, partial [Candidatus Binatia bacterium]
MMNMVNALKVLREHCAALSGLADGDLQALLGASEIRDIAATDALLRTGDEARSIFIVLEGAFATLVARDWGEERVLEEAAPGDLVGTVEIVSGDRRLADVRAMVDSRVVEIPRKTFEKLLGSHEQIWERVADCARTSICRILTSLHLGRLLGTSGLKISDPMLRLQAEQDWLDFERDILTDLERNIDWLPLKRGEHLFRQGDAAEDALVVVSGVLQVSIQDAFGAEKVVGEVGPGEIVGEVALFTEQARTASVVAMRDCELFRVPRRIFSRITERYPQILLSLYRSSFQRLVRNTSAKVFRPRRPNTVLLRAHADMETDEFQRELLAAMGTHGSVGHLTSASVDESLGQEGITGSRSGQAAEVRLVQW